MIQLDRVSFAYGQGEQTKVALREVTFSLSPGEFVAVIGANGSGKSTLVRLMNGLLTPSAGAVAVDGYSPWIPEQLREIRRLVGMVFQNPENQIVGGTAEDDVAFGLENLGLGREEMRVRISQALDALRLSELREAIPHTLSGGQKQRLALAGVLAMRPRYLILDEPTTMLDPLGKAEVRRQVTALRREAGVGVCLVTHAMEEASLADRVVVLHEGKVVGDAEPAAIFSDAALLARTGLALPPCAALARDLAAAGVPFSSPILSVDQLVAALKGGPSPGPA